MKLQLAIVGSALLLATSVSISSEATPTPMKPVAVLTVCADPNNLPFSNKAQEGFENKIVEIIASDMHASVSYVWWAQRRGYIRNTLGESRCDIWPGVASGVKRIATTAPYYRSTYVFVTRVSSGLVGLSFDDPRLQSLKIGVQMVGNDATNTPPAHSLARRGLVNNVRGYMLYGNYETPNPPATIVEAVARGDIDAAIVWGPLAGYFALFSAVPLRLENVTPETDAAIWPMTYEISMGVRPNSTLRPEVEFILKKEKPRIEEVLRRFGIPILPGI